MMRAVAVQATLGLHEAASRCWDVVIVGAGPAGSVAAREAVRQGLAVLLVDQASFPRQKTCGGCLSAPALALLSDLGLRECIWELGGQPVTALQLVERRRVTIPVALGIALSRQVLDAALIRAAIQEGAAFLPETRAVAEGLVTGGRGVTLSQGQAAGSVLARVVVIATGLGAPGPDDEPACAVQVRSSSRIGVGTVLEHAPDAYPPHTVVMACGDGGYVGCVRVEQNRFDVAAALDPGFVRTAGGPGRAVSSILERAACPSIPQLADASWRGTAPMTAWRTAVAADRLLYVGDAAGYVEPFTGEGMAWAMASAAAAAPLIAAGSRRWREPLVHDWITLHQRLIVARQRRCLLLTTLLRFRSARQFALTMLSTMPALARPWVRATHRSFPLPRGVSPIRPTGLTT